ncbi:MAG TPA: hypothetical protein VLC46_10500 [Thermoanaerobaculia bacterium]|jgi:hypothetical protein|nr:hypothetical protein [Thermoanaerobaculia bacterium]
MHQVHTVLLSNLIVMKMAGIVDNVRGLAEIIQEEPDLPDNEREALLRATRRMLAEADVVLAWISQVPMSDLRN